MTVLHHVAAIIAEYGYEIHLLNNSLGQINALKKIDLSADDEPKVQRVSLLAFFCPKTHTLKVVPGFYTSAPFAANSLSGEEMVITVSSNNEWETEVRALCYRLSQQDRSIVV